MSRRSEEQDLVSSGGGTEGLPRRWSAQRKAEVVFRLLRGEGHRRARERRRVEVDDMRRNGCTA